MYFEVNIKFSVLIFLPFIFGVADTLQKNRGNPKLFCNNTVKLADLADCVGKSFSALGAVREEIALP